MFARFFGMILQLIRKFPMIKIGMNPSSSERRSLGVHHIAYYHDQNRYQHVLDVSW